MENLEVLEGDLIVACASQYAERRLKANLKRGVRIIRLIPCREVRSSYFLIDRKEFLRLPQISQLTEKPNISVDCFAGFRDETKHTRKMRKNGNRSESAT